MMSLSDDTQADVIDAFNTTSRYLEGILNINNVKYTLQSSNLIKLIPLIPKPHFQTCICQFLMILFLPKFILNVTTLILKFVNFPLLDGDVPRSTSSGVFISQLIRLARASNYVTNFNTRNKLLTQKLLKQGYLYH